MNILIQILLWLFLVLAAVGILSALTDAKKPRQTVEPAAGCLAGGLILACAVPLILVLTGSYSDKAKILAAVLAGFLVYSTGQAVREVHGVRGPRTPVSTTLAVLAGFVEITGLVMLLAEV